MNKYIIHVSNSDLLVHDKEKIIRLKCPFKVKPKFNYETLQTDKTYMVSLVKPSKEYKLLYTINGIFYNFDLFEIIL